MNMKPGTIVMLTDKALRQFGHRLDDIEVFMTEDMNWKCSIGRFKELGRETPMTGTGLDMVLKIRGTDQFFKRDDDAEYGWTPIDPIQLDIKKTVSSELVQFYYIRFNNNGGQ